MRVLFLGDVADTGFGTVTLSLVPRLLALGHDVRVLSQNTTAGIPDELFGRTYDAGRQPVLPLLTGEASWKPEAAIMLGDFALVRRVVMELAPEMTEAFRGIPTFHYVPIEGVDLPRSLKDLWSVIRPVAMSRFGQAEIAKVTGETPPLAYHGVDTETFFPVELGRQLNLDGKRIASKEMAKAFFGYRPDRTMILRTDRHMPRKRYASLLRAMTPVLLGNPSVDLVIHCRVYDEGGDLRHELSKLPEEIQGRVVLTGAHDSFKGLPRNVLACLYNAADLYVSVSAEGFGLTIAEAIACGVPAAAMDYSSVTEVVGNAGVLVPVDHLLDNEYSYAWAAVDEAKFAAAVDFLVKHPAKRRELGRNGPKHIAQFTWDGCARVFSDLVKEATTPQLALVAGGKA